MSDENLGAVQTPETTSKNQLQLYKLKQITRSRKVNAAIMFLNNHVGIVGDNMQREAHQEQYSLLDSTPRETVVALTDALTAAARFLRAEFERPE